MKRRLCFLLPLFMLPCFSFNSMNQRLKRDAGGELDIVNNNAHPIHAEVKPDTAQKSEVEKPEAEVKTEAEVTTEGKVKTEAKKEVHSESPQDGPEKVNLPCPLSKLNLALPHIEMGTVFKVTAPKDVVKDIPETEVKSLRKSMPANNKLDIVRNLNRAVTVVVLAVSMGIEFYPIFVHLYNSVFSGEE